MSSQLAFDAVVGQSKAKLALRLLAVDPTIGGVLLVGPPGSAKTTLARGLAKLLGAAAPFIEIPLGSTEDRVKGSIDVASVLAGGEVRVQNGLLAMAHGGVLYIDEINLLADHVVDLILDAAATGVNRVERDAVSVVQPARFSLIGTMNPEEGELRPQLLDRFAMTVQVDPLMDPNDRQLALRRRLDAELDREVDLNADAIAGVAIDEARAHLMEVALEAQLEGIARRCAELGIGSLRADVAVAKAARANAALSGRNWVEESDVDCVMELIVGHRQRLEPPSGQPRSRPGPDEPPNRQEEQQGDQPDTGADNTDVSSHGSGYGGSDGSIRDLPEEPSQANFGERLASLTRRKGNVEGQGAEVARHHEVVKSGAFSLTRTIVARLGRSGPGGLSPEDVRYLEIERAQKRCVIFVVDVSASVAGREATALVIEAIEQLLGTAYRERAQVAVVSFGGETAQVSLRPTRSLEVARTRLLGLERAGRTPLARGLAAGRDLALDLRRRGTEPLLVVLTDARPNEVGIDDPFAAALDQARRLAKGGLEVVIVDLESNTFRLGFAEQLAQAANALYVQAQAS
ncbi:AAA family ATPase [Ferrimicrobium sp.]|uniref:AAA family ATPase n=1 Tax=Ferrimicrobium sp. TaxID=2926050 RepID=UPI00260B57D3|nr:AAA family ATPase [Ferrimicrobium sp.]